VTEPRVATRYAEGLFRLAQERREVGEIGRELEHLAALVRETPELARLMSRPDLPAERKVEALRRALGPTFSGTIHALLSTLVGHGRGDSVEMVGAAYQELVDEAAGVVRAEARTVLPLSEEQRARLIRAVERLTRKPVKLEEQIDPRVLAGVRLRVGDNLIDGSAAGRLARMREELLEERG
jgi:F-type H+-transporting ATPase subunit delta